MVEIATGHNWELRLGRWQDVLRGVEASCLICDPPYSDRTHKGHDGGQGADGRRLIDYGSWSADDLRELVAGLPVMGWRVVMTDHVMLPHLETAYREQGLYSFAPIPFVTPGGSVRLAGDGPANWSVWIGVARPRSLPWSRWGALPGAYVLPPGERDRRFIGGKPLWIMRELVRHYSRPGDLIVEPCSGYGTTLVAAIREGRRAVGAEVDPETFELAVERLRRTDEELGHLGAEDGHGRQLGLLGGDHDADQSR